MLVGCHADSPRGIKPGTPVVTTVLSRRLVSMRLISLNASSGSGEMLKFSFARDALLGVVSKAVPRFKAHDSSTCRCHTNLRGDFRNDGIFDRPWSRSVTQR